MFQDNPLLAQLKQQLHDKTLRVEGIVKSTDKGYGSWKLTDKNPILFRRRR